MYLEKVTSKNEQLFFDHTKNRKLEFFFFLMDYKQYPEKTQLFIALDDDKNIHGVFIIWKERTIQLRGEEEAVVLFLNYLKDNEIKIKNITGTINHQNILSQFNSNSPEPGPSNFNMYRMALIKGNEKLFEKYSYIQLDETKKETIAAFLRKSDPLYFGSKKAEDIMMDKNNPYFAIMEGEKIISLAGLWVDEMMGIINLVATDPEYRKMGYATSIVSTGVKWLFEKTDQILIHVRKTNLPAIKTYQKVGYSIRFEYIVKILIE